MKTFANIDALAKKNLKASEKKKEYIEKRDSMYTKEQLFREKCMEAVQELQNKKEQEEYHDQKHQEFLNKEGK